MTVARVRAAYESRLAAWAAARVPKLPVIFQNVPADMPTVDHLRMFILPAQTMSIDLAGDHRGYRGVVQVSIFCETKKGASKAEAIAAELDTLFPNSLLLTQAGLDILVISPVSAAPALTEPDWYHVPCSFRYAADDI